MLIYLVLVFHEKFPIYILKLRPKLVNLTRYPLKVINIYIYYLNIF